MANKLTANPIYLEAVANSEVTRVLNIQSIVWSHTEDHNIAADNDLELQDSAGNVILEFRQSIARGPSMWLFPKGLQINGIKATELDGGEVYIYLCGHSE